MPGTSDNLSTAMALASWTRTCECSALQEMLTVAAQPDILSFALGLPAAELFPVNAFAESVNQVLEAGPTALQYGPPFRPLKSHIRELMARRGVVCREEQIFLTTGAQQGISLLTRLLLNPGGQILSEEMIYTGFQQAIEQFQADVLTVRTDLDRGIDTDAVESLLIQGAHPAFIYTVPDGHNPLGLSMTPAKRARLVELARLYRFPIIEDDAYGFLHYENEPVPPMRALDEQWVFYLGSFSKILAPALRVGWLVVPERLISVLSAIKESSDINTATLSQRAISAYLDRGHLDQHLDLLRRQYKARRDCMVQALREHFPPQTLWRVPTHGFFIWVEIPGECDMTRLMQVAIQEERIAFIPAQAFRVKGAQPESQAMRLNFSNCNLERIEDGIKRLARLVKREST